MDPIFISSWYGSEVYVYPDRVVRKNIFGVTETVLMKQIASVDSEGPLSSKVLVETTGGKRVVLNVAPNLKEVAKSAIVKAMQPV